MNDPSKKAQALSLLGRTSLVGNTLHLLPHIVTGGIKYVPCGSTGRGHLKVWDWFSLEVPHFFLWLLLLYSFTIISHNHGYNNFWDLYRGPSEPLSWGWSLKPSVHWDPICQNGKIECLDSIYLLMEYLKFQVGLKQKTKILLRNLRLE